MVVVVYCYLLLTVHQATYSVREGVILKHGSPSLIFTSIYLSIALFCLTESPIGYLTKHKQYLTDHIWSCSSLAASKASLSFWIQVWCPRETWMNKTLLSITTVLLSKTLRPQPLPSRSSVANSGALWLLYGAPVYEWVLLCDYEGWKKKKASTLSWLSWI